MRNFVFMIFISQMVFSFENIEKNINRYLDQQGLNPNGVSIMMETLEKNQRVFVRGEHQMLNPASSIKILTSALALDILGPAHVVKTQVHQHSGVLCLKGGLDPSLVYEDLWRLAEQAHAKGLNKIDRMVVDESLLPSFNPNADDFALDAHRAFNNEMGALSVNYNALAFKVIPTQLDHKAQVFSLPTLQRFKINNKVLTKKTGSRSDIKVNIQKIKQKYEVEVSGRVGVDQTELEVYGSVPDPGIYSGEIFLEALLRLGHSYSGFVEQGTCQGPPLATLDSVSVSNMVLLMNKFSNNFIAHMLYALVSAKQANPVVHWFKQAGIKDELVLDNPSGLSRNTKISAHTLVQIFKHALKNPAYGPEFLSSMSLGGQDGTLKRRFKGLDLRAKSGSLKGVTSLVGLVPKSKVGPVVFAIVFNHQKLSNWQLQSIEENLLKFLE